jgi:CheY-like chemotaxis protein
MARPRLVLADDHSATRLLMTGLLAPDFEIVAAVADGKAALEAAAALRPDVVVLDISMPILNGFEAAAAIRQLPNAPRIVFSSAHDDVDFAHAAFAGGGSALVVKRNLARDLVPAVRRALTFHGVFFYEHPASLSRTVADFIGQGLVAGEPVILITTAAHQAGIREELRARGIEAEPRSAATGLLWLDADEVLSRFMVADVPDARRFDAAVTPIVDQLAGSRTRPIRAYGEMVDVLWKNSQQTAAASLEVLWNQLLSTRACSLLCGYASDAVGHGDGYRRICDQHSHLEPLR